MAFIGNPLKFILLYFAITIESACETPTAF